MYMKTIPSKNANSVLIQSDQDSNQKALIKLNPMMISHIWRCLAYHQTKPEMKTIFKEEEKNEIFIYTILE